VKIDGPPSARLTCARPGRFDEAPGSERRDAASRADRASFAPAEFRASGEPWPDRDERYRRSEEFSETLKGFWTGERFTFKGDFYRIDDSRGLEYPPGSIARARPWTSAIGG
jgi:Luciferase-like monooxygenase